MAQKIVAGNWKMNLQFGEGQELVNDIMSENRRADVEVMIFPASLYAQAFIRHVDGQIAVGVQNFNANPSGAFTGEMSAAQVASAGVSIALIGHSERRTLFAETDQDIKGKVIAAVESNLKFIFCCGEPLEVREAGKEFDYVLNQLEAGLFHLSSEQLENAIIAYEPVWAIGTGRTATSQQAEEMHAKIREWISVIFSPEVAASVSILYGGSCNENNAKELFACPNVDGGLIGGASLKAESFLTIINSF